MGVHSAPSALCSLVYEDSLATPQLALVPRSPGEPHCHLRQLRKVGHIQVATWWTYLPQIQ